MRKRDSAALDSRDLCALGRLEIDVERAGEREADGVLARIVERGRGQQHLACRRGQLGYAPFDKRPHVGGHGQRLACRGYALLIQEPAYLQREQRVTAGDLVDAHEHRA